ncbi:MAG TPA: arsenite methyltransferase [Clostridia bacterium]|nr:arsenite methyltransferase [Clostridia bacterium]
MKSNDEIRDYVRKNYARVAIQGTQGSCCGTGCCGSNETEVRQAYAKIGYFESDLSEIPDDANMCLGCGNPVAIASLRPGETVLDLGCGGGFDCFLAAKRVGVSGRVIGVDMTPDMISLARKNADKYGNSNVQFRLGEIEHLPVEDNSVDVIISNCVINLSPDKKQVFKEAYRVLKPGGRLSISDVVATARIPDDIKSNLLMVACCVGGAEYIDDVKQMLKDAGFINIRLTPKENSRKIIKSWNFGNNIENYVASFMIEAVK